MCSKRPQLSRKEGETDEQWSLITKVIREKKKEKKKEGGIKKKEKRVEESEK